MQASRPEAPSLEDSGQDPERQSAASGSGRDGADLEDPGESGSPELLRGQDAEWVIEGVDVDEIGSVEELAESAPVPATEEQQEGMGMERRDPRKRRDLHTGRPTSRTRCVPVVAAPGHGRQRDRVTPADKTTADDRFPAADRAEGSVRIGGGGDVEKPHRRRWARVGGVSEGEITVPPGIGCRSAPLRSLRRREDGSRRAIIPRVRYPPLPRRPGPPSIRTPSRKPGSLRLQGGRRHLHHGECRRGGRCARSRNGPRRM